MEPVDRNQRQSAILSGIYGVDESIKPMAHLIVAAMDPARIFMIWHGRSCDASANRKPSGPFFVASIHSIRVQGYSDQPEWI